MDAILVGTDGSPSAKQAVAFAVDLARDTGAVLHIVSVRPPMLHGRGGPLAARTTLPEVHTASLLTQACAAEARAVGVEAEAHEATGDEAKAIAAMAEELGVDLIVVGSRGHGALGAALLGSVSRALVTRSRVPVTIVRPTAARATTTPA